MYIGSSDLRSSFGLYAHLLGEAIPIDLELYEY